MPHGIELDDPHRRVPAVAAWLDSLPPIESAHVRRTCGEYCAVIGASLDRWHLEEGDGHVHLYMLRDLLGLLLSLAAELDGVSLDPLDGDT